MSTLADRLRDVVRPPASAPREARPAVHANIAETLEGDWREARGHRYLVVDRKYGPGYRHGHVAIADVMPPWPHVDLLAGVSFGGSPLFLNLETTGLSGGAGTYAFLVGCAWFDGATFRTRQFLLTSFGAEAAMLDEVASLASAVAGVATYNGKSFDLPLLQTRFALQRIRSVLDDLPHLDMLFPARRLWKDVSIAAPETQSSCRLVALERTQLGFMREGDVPGVEIPLRYFDFVRSGDPRPLDAVLEHNRLDLISLAMLVGRASSLLDGGPASARTAREAIGLGRLLESRGRDPEARRCYARAAGLDEAGPMADDAATQVEALRAYALSSRRLRAYVDAAVAWSRVLEIRGGPSHVAREAAEALAIHHEHRLRDHGMAKVFALQSLGAETRRSRQDALTYRLARLDRKLAGTSSGYPLPHDLFS